MPIMQYKSFFSLNFGIDNESRGYSRPYLSKIDTTLPSNYCAGSSPVELR
jgi:hypothetical protein